MTKRLYIVNALLESDEPTDIPWSREGIEEETRSLLTSLGVTVKKLSVLEREINVDKRTAL